MRLTKIIKQAWWHTAISVPQEESETHLLTSCSRKILQFKYECLTYKLQSMPTATTSVTH